MKRLRLSGFFVHHSFVLIEPVQRESFFGERMMLIITTTVAKYLIQRINKSTCDRRLSDDMQPNLHGVPEM